MGWLLSILTTANVWQFSAFDGKRAWTITDEPIAVSSKIKHGRVTPMGLVAVTGDATSAENPLAPLSVTLYKDKSPSEIALHEADKLAVAGDLKAATKLYSAAGKTFTGEFGEMAAVTALELHARLHVKISPKTLAKLQHRLELASTRLEELPEARRQEMGYRLARLAMVSGHPMHALPLLARQEPIKQPLTADVRRQALLDQAVREIVVDAYVRNDNEGLARFYVGYARLIIGHGDSRWLETLIGQAFYELDLPHDAVRVLAFAPEETPIIARELLAASAAYDADMKLRAQEHLTGLRAFVHDDRLALLTRLLGDMR